VSGTTLAAISIERHRSIVYPIKKPLGARWVFNLWSWGSISPFFFFATLVSQNWLNLP
jgi:hypothetical protein